MLDGVRHGMFLRVSQFSDFTMGKVHGQMLVKKYLIKNGHVLHAN